MQQQVTINDAALGQWALNVCELSKLMDGRYSFEGCYSAVDLTTGEVNTNSKWLQMLCDYAKEEGYVEQNICAQCEVLYEAAIAEEA